MPTVEYDHQFAYLHGEDGRQFPGLLVNLHRLGEAEGGVDVDAYLDTGAEYSLFDGELARVVGLDLVSGEDFAFNSTSGERLPAKRHGVVVEHSDLGQFELVLAFSIGGIRRNLLGRDFLARVQVGFRERQSQFYATSAP